MKKILFCLMILSNSFAQTIEVAATEGGSVVLTPSGIVRSAAKAVLQPSVPASRNFTTEKAVVKPAEIAFYEFKNIDVKQARMLIQPFRNALYDEGVSKEDYDTFILLRKFIQDNKGFASSSKTITVKVPANKIENVFQGGSYESKAILKERLRQLDIEEALYKQAVAQEKAAGVLPENSKIRIRADKFTEQ